MRGRLVIVAVATAALAAGCGHSHHAAIADYITRVNDVERGMAGPLQQVTRVNQRFAKSQSNPKVQVELATSERTLRRLELRLRKVVPPSQAAHLHTLLLEPVRREVGLMQETRQFAAFVGRYQQALLPLQPASTRLKAKLSEKAKGNAETKALDQEKADQLVAYAATAAQVIAALRPLAPPPVWRSTYSAELSSVTRMRSAALALAQAIRANDSAAVPPLLEAFDRAALANATTSAQKRVIADVKAYDARVRAVSKLAQRVNLERARLERRYG